MWCKGKEAGNWWWYKKKNCALSTLTFLKGVFSPNSEGESNASQFNYSVYGPRRGDVELHTNHVPFKAYWERTSHSYLSQMLMRVLKLPGRLQRSPPWIQVAPMQPGYQDHFQLLSGSEDYKHKYIKHRSWPSTHTEEEQPMHEKWPR